MCGRRWRDSLPSSACSAWLGFTASTSLHEFPKALPRLSNERQKLILFDRDDGNAAALGFRTYHRFELALRHEKCARILAIVFPARL